jgi:5,10-methylene-tetrahydrofolate dehydrogenase/methenyl tetrahydrofolate cyclohydrolase
VRRYNVATVGNTSSMQLNNRNTWVTICSLSGLTKNSNIMIVADTKSEEFDSEIVPATIF